MAGGGGLDRCRGVVVQGAVEAAWPQRARPIVLGGDPGVGQSRSLADDDLEEFKGCVDLGIRFSYNEIPELFGTLHVLELC
jgi:hypothetical protein